MIAILPQAFFTNRNPLIDDFTEKKKKNENSLNRVDTNYFLISKKQNNIHEGILYYY